MSDKTPIEQLYERYHAALHAIQSGIAQMMHIDPSETSPKHLRVGINSSLINSSALEHVLISKGVITEQEYLIALVELAEAEKANYEAELTARMGGKTKIKLG